jgi:hypothetical protein
VTLSDAVDMLAFGRDRLPIGLSNIEEHAARLRAGLALMLAGKEGKVTLCGNATFQMEPYRQLLNKTYRGLKGKETLQTEDLTRHSMEVEAFADDLRRFARKIMQGSRK